MELEGCYRDFWCGQNAQMLENSGGWLCGWSRKDRRIITKSAAVKTRAQWTLLCDFSFASTNPGGFDASPDKILHKPTRDKNKTTQRGTNKHLVIECKKKKADKSGDLCHYLVTNPPSR